MTGGISDPVERTALENAMNSNEPHGISPAASFVPPIKVTIPALQEKKRHGARISAVTAYDCAMARLVDEASIDLVLVGDSAATTMLGYENTLAVTVEEMLLFTRAVRRGVRRALLAADLPYASYQVDPTEGVRNALRFVKEAGAEAVKVEGGRKRADLVRRMTDAEIPVIAHIGLEPQSVHRMGGYRVQGKSAEAGERLMEDALALESAGAALIVLEGITREVAAAITRELEIPTIGIGAGPDCDGQILVLHDLLHLIDKPPAKFVRRYADVGSAIRAAVEHYRRDVEEGRFPAERESYHQPTEAREAFQPVRRSRKA
jgi:3-methyl-2-oxobutanoate hydroxymethyltransferase